MREIFVDTSETLSQTLFSNGVETDADGDVTVDVIELETGAVPVSGAVATRDGVGLYTYTMDNTLVQDPNSYKVVWNYQIGGETYNPSDSVEVVVPLVYQSELPAELQEPNKTYEEYVEMERLVRKVIQAYTDQRFDYRLNRTKTALGKDADVLDLPDRLFRLDSASLEYDDASTPGDESLDITPYVRRVHDNFYQLRKKTSSSDSIKRDIQEVLRGNRFFREGRVYAVTGDWGYEVVPNDVSLAARILVEAYFCDDSQYREKNIANIRSADWRIEYAVTGSSTTGSANADMILNQYRNWNMVVI